MDKFLFRIPTELKSKIEQIAKDDRRSLNTQLIIAVEQFVENKTAKNQEQQKSN